MGRCPILGNIFAIAGSLRALPWQGRGPGARADGLSAAPLNGADLFLDSVPMKDIGHHDCNEVSDVHRQVHHHIDQDEGTTDDSDAHSIILNALASNKIGRSGLILWHEGRNDT